MMDSIRDVLLFLSWFTLGDMCVKVLWLIVHHKGHLKSKIETVISKNLNQREHEIIWCYHENFNYQPKQ